MYYEKIKSQIKALEANAALWGQTRKKTARQGILIDHYGHGVQSSVVVRSSCWTTYQIVRLYRTWYVMNPNVSLYTQGEYLWASTSEASCMEFLAERGEIIKIYP